MIMIHEFFPLNFLVNQLPLKANWLTYRKIMWEKWPLKRPKSIHLHQLQSGTKNGGADNSAPA